MRGEASEPPALHTMPTALIQLVSEQPMPNLLALIALRPERVIHVCTPRTALRSAQIAEAARQAGLTPEFESVQLSPIPGIQKTGGAVRAAIRDARTAEHQPVVNFTGGTKLMSIAAFACAMNQKVCSLYVDTDDAVFVDGGSGPALSTLLGDDQTFTAIARRLTVNSVVVAHGRERVTGGQDWRPLLTLGRHLLHHRTEEQATHEAIHGQDGLLPGGHEPRDPAGWLQVLDRPLILPDAVIALSAEAGVLDLSSGHARLPQSSRAELEELAAHHVSDFRSRYYNAVAPLQRSLTALGGAWWEVCVADAATRCGFFRDVRWAAHVGERRGFDVEEDILALEGVRLVAVSCKRAGAGKQRLVAHLAEFNARTEQLGGRFVRRFLALAWPPRGRQWEILQEKARELNIRLLTPETFERPDAFAP